MIALNFTNSIQKKTKVIEAAFLGLQDYEKSVQLQSDLLLLAQQSKHGYVIGLEHPAVLTLGYRASVEHEIKQDNNLPIVRISRGGLATIHSEGQLVIYPIVNLRELNLGVRDYVLLLLQTTQELLKTFKINSFIDKKCIGLYSQYGKIAFCGIQIKNGISQHGLSLNVRNDLALFSSIRSCGVENPEFDSLSRHRISHTLSEIYQIWIEIFKRNLN